MPPALINLPALASAAPEASQSMSELGEIATSYFKRFPTKTKDAVTIFGIHYRGGKVLCI